MKKILLTAVLMAAAGTAFAGERSGGECYQILWWSFCTEGPKHTNPGGPASAPEIDPASAMSGLALLAGGLVMLRGRRLEN